MKGVSAVIVSILLLMISVAMVSLGYIFMTEMVSETTEAGSQAVEQATTSILSSMRIESMSGRYVYIRNTGKVNLTQFGAFVGGVLDTGISVTPTTPLEPGAVGTIQLSASLSSGNVVKITSAQGAQAIASYP